MFWIYLATAVAIAGLGVAGIWYHARLRRRGETPSPADEFEIVDE